MATNFPLFFISLYELVKSRDNHIMQEEMLIKDRYQMFKHLSNENSSSSQYIIFKSKITIKVTVKLTNFNSTHKHINNTYFEHMSGILLDNLCKTKATAANT